MATSTNPRQKFTTNQDWNSFIAAQFKQAQENGTNHLNVDFVKLRRACYSEIEALRSRPLLVYATKFINLPNGTPGIPNSIELADIAGFQDMISTIPNENRSVDILIHSPGGKPEATERLVDILRQRFDEVHFLIPHSAYSAATMLALSGNSIVMHPAATLGPIDPQINGRPARTIKKGFEKVRDQVKTFGPSVLPAYMPLLEKLSLELLEICDDSEALSQNLAKDWLTKYMLPAEKYPGQIDAIVKFFSDYDEHRLHSRPIVSKKLIDFQMPVEVSSGALTDLLWEAFILIENFFQMTQFVKIFENNREISWGTQVQLQGSTVARPPVPPVRRAEVG